MSLVEGIKNVLFSGSLQFRSFQSYSVTKNITLYRLALAISLHDNCSTSFEGKPNRPVTISRTKNQQSGFINIQTSCTPQSCLQHCQWDIVQISFLRKHLWYISFLSYAALDSSSEKAADTCKNLFERQPLTTQVSKSFRESKYDSHNQSKLAVKLRKLMSKALFSRHKITQIWLELKLIRVRPDFIDTDK